MGILLLGASSNNDSRVTINVPTGQYLNLAKGFGFAIDPNNQSADGYPVTVPSSGWGSNPSMPLGYYGSFVWKWSGTGCMQLSGHSIVVTSGGLDVFEINANSGDAKQNITLLDQSFTSGVTNPRVVFSFGWNIQAISNNGSGLIRITTKTGWFAWGGATGLVVQISGANANTGANGTWPVTKIDDQTFDLQGSAFTNAQASPAGIANYAAQNLDVHMYPGGTYSGMSGLVWCKSADEADITSGLIADTVLVNQLVYLMNSASRGTPGWLRFMDVSGVQSSFEADFTQRIPASYINYSPGNYRPGYWTPSTNGAITNIGSDAYTCADPSVSVWSGSSYIDNANVQGIFSATNTAGNPTLNVGGHGAKPIYGTATEPFIFRFSGPPASAGLSMQWTFTAPWLNSGSPYVFTYTTVAGDTGSVAALNANLVLALNADAVLATAGKIQFGNSGQIQVYPRTPQAGALTITYSSGPAICTIIKIDPSAFVSGGKATFTFNYLLDGWIYRSGGLIMSAPLESIVDLCNRVGAHCWFNWGTTKGAFVTAVTNYFATNLSAGLKFGTEVGNEWWNSAAYPYSNYSAWGQALGFLTSSNASIYSYGSLRTIQYAALSRAAWNAVRTPSDHYIFQMSAVFDVTSGGNFDTHQLKGASLVTSNAIYNLYSGLNGTGPIASYNASPNRPVDGANVTGCAPYWNSHWMGSGSFTNANTVVGPVSENIPWLQAAKDYSSGLTTTAFTSMVNQFTRATVRASGNNFGSDWVDYQTVFTTQEALCAQYDGSRVGGLPKLGIMDYEGGPAFGIGADGNSGVNSVNSTDVAALAARMAALSWTSVAAYTQSGTDNRTEMATMVFTMLQAWKHDASYKNMIKQYYYQARVTTSGANREVRGAQFGYFASNWGLFDTAGNSYTSYDAIHEFNG